MKLTNEQIKAILDGAPEGATHIGAYDTQYFEYWKVKSIGDDEEYQCFDHGVWNEQEYWYGHHLLSDLREILELRQEVERLKAEQSEVAARAVAEACNQSCSVIANVEQEGVVNSREGVYCDVWLSSSDLMRYANQLREQGK